MKNKIRMIKTAIEVRPVLCFVGPSLALSTTPATLNLFDNSVIPFTNATLVLNSVASS